MQHVEPTVFSAFVAGTPIAIRDRRHVDRCVACRRILRERGVASADIAPPSASRSRTALAASIAAAVAVAMVATPLRGAAMSFIAIFEPQHVAALPFRLDDLRTLSQVPNLGDYATSRTLLASRSARFDDARQAAAVAKMQLRLPTNVPGQIRAASFQVQTPGSEMLSFNQATVLDRFDASPKATLPADIAGTILRFDFGSMVIAAYDTGLNSEARPLDVRSRSSSVGRLGDASARTGWTAAPAPNESRIVTRPAQDQPHRVKFGSYSWVFHGRSTSATSHNPARDVSAFSMPLIVAQMPVPRVSSSGVSVQRLVAYEIERPGVSPNVIAAFRAIGDLSTTLPIPIPVDKAYSQSVAVDGVTGIGLGDETGLGAAVVWQKAGMLYVVAATRPAREVLAIANSMR